MSSVTISITSCSSSAILGTREASTGAPLFSTIMRKVHRTRSSFGLKRGKNAGGLIGRGRTGVDDGRSVLADAAFRSEVDSVDRARDDVMPSKISGQSGHGILLMPLQSDRTPPSSLSDESFATLCAYNGRPVVRNHPLGITLLHPHNCVANTCLEVLRSQRRLQNRVEDSRMQIVHNLPFFVSFRQRCVTGRGLH